MQTTFKAIEVMLADAITRMSRQPYDEDVEVLRGQVIAALKEAAAKLDEAKCHYAAAQAQQAECIPF